MITEKLHPRLKHAFIYAEKLLYEDYYNCIISGETVDNDVFTETLNWFISTEEYEKCKQLVIYDKRK